MTIISKGEYFFKTITFIYFANIFYQYISYMFQAPVKNKEKMVTFEDELATRKNPLEDVFM